MDTQNMATALMTFDPSSSGLYIQGQVVFHDGSFYTVDKVDPSGSPEESTSDFTIIDNGGASTFNISNTSNYQTGQLVVDDGTVYLVTSSNPTGAPGSSDDYMPLSGDSSATGGPTGPTGAAGEAGPMGPTGPTGEAGQGGNLLVGPGTGASGTAAAYNALFSSLSFAVSAASNASGMGGIKINVSAGPSGPIVELDSSALVRAINNLEVTQTYDPGRGEQDTGATYHGKQVFRRAFEFTTNRAANEQDDRMLIDASGYVDAIVNTGGYWMTGNQAEKYPVNAAYVSTKSLYGFAYVDTGNKLVFRSNSSLNRDGSAETANTFLWVDYTRVDSSAPPEPSAV